MSFRILGFILLMLSQIAFAQGRKPAVEDFVGIEVEHVEEDAPQGTESLFNFEKDMDKFEKDKSKSAQTSKVEASQNPEQTNTVMIIVTAILVLGLPAMIWFLMMYHLRQKAHLESASNIEVLENYRKQKEEAKKAQEEIKKAS